MPGKSQLQLLLNAAVYAPEPLGVQHLLVSGGKIVWMGSDRLEFGSGLAVEIVDLAGQRLIPGLMDGHAHLTGGGGEAGFASRVPEQPLSAFTTAGVTTVVGLLGTDDTVRTTAALLARVRGLREEGLSAYGYTGGYHLPLQTLTGSVRTDILHLDPIIGVGELAISDHRSSQPTLDEILRVASDTHVAGMMSNKAGVVHFHLGDGERGLDLLRQALAVSEIPPRVFNPTHVNRQRALFDEAIALAGQGCYVDITAFPADPSDPAVDASQALLEYLDSTAPASRVTVSSDGGGCLPKFDGDGRIVAMDVGRAQILPETLQELQRLGAPLDVVLPAFTSNVADLLKLPAKGRIAAGNDADLVVLGDDGQVHHVMAGGAWHVWQETLQIPGQFE